MSSWATIIGTAPSNAVSRYLQTSMILPPRCLSNHLWVKWITTRFKMLRLQPPDWEMQAGLIHFTSHAAGWMSVLMLNLLTAHSSRRLRESLLVYMRCGICSTRRRRAGVLAGRMNDLGEQRETHSSCGAVYREHGRVTFNTDCVESNPYISDDVNIKCNANIYTKWKTCQQDVFHLSVLCKTTDQCDFGKQDLNY